MGKAVLLQFGALLLVAAGAWVLSGHRGAISSLLGGASYLLPNLVFWAAIRFAAAAGKATATTLFVAEFCKVAATIVLLLLAYRFYRDLHWLAMLIGLVVALKSNLFALLVKN